MKLRPLHDRIIVERVEQETKSAGGIIIPESAKEKPMEGKVVAVGEGKKLDDGSRATMDLKANDRILFGKYAGTEITLDSTEYLIMREDDVLAVLD